MTPPAPWQVSLEARALRWLAQREHSRAELRRKLLRHVRIAAAASGVDAADEPSAAASAAELDQLLDGLEARGYLSDTRFAASRLRTRTQRWGNARILDELAQHGVTLDAAAAEALRASEVERARALWSRKFGHPAPDPAARARQMRFLCGRGFPADVVRRVVPPAAVAAADAGDD